LQIGDFDIETINFTSEEGTIYHLPRDNHCHMIYCNAEGIQWLDNYRLLVSSDKAKSRQPFWCDAKDQSIHIFAMPPGWEPHEPAGGRKKGAVLVAAGMGGPAHMDSDMVVAE